MINTLLHYASHLDVITLLAEHGVRLPRACLSIRHYRNIIAIYEVIYEWSNRLVEDLLVVGVLVVYVVKCKYVRYWYLLVCTIITLLKMNILNSNLLTLLINLDYASIILCYFTL